MKIWNSDLNLTMEQKFTESSEFRESDKSRNHELGSI